MPRKKTSSRTLGAVTDDPVVLASRAVEKAEKALAAKDNVGVRQGASLAWLAISSLADVAAGRLGLPTPKGHVSRRAVLWDLEQYGKVPHGSIVNRFESARSVMHGDCFHGDECPRPDVLVGMMQDVRSVVEIGVAAIPEAQRRHHRRKR